jgi:hypothetical protein
MRVRYKNTLPRVKQTDRERESVDDNTLVKGRLGFSAFLAGAATFGVEVDVVLAAPLPFGAALIEQVCSCC